MVVGGPTLNRLGLQVARACKEQVAWRLREPRVPEHVRAAYETMDRDGVVVIPDFLPEPHFRALRADYERSLGDSATREVVYGENLVSRQLTVSQHAGRYPDTMRFVRDNDFLLDLASAVGRRSRSYKPHVVFFTLTKPTPAARHVDHDSAQFAHPDRHYPFVKVFLYLKDVEPGGAPFSYAKGSHRFSLERLRFEYEHANRWAERAQADTSRTAEQLAADDALSACVERSMRKQATSCEPIYGKANTLIVANNQGFHKRGPFTSGVERQVVYIDFKYLESVAHWLYPVVRRLAPGA